MTFQKTVEIMREWFRMYQNLVALNFTKNKVQRIDLVMAKATYLTEIR